jgi:hypothetical protein
MIKEIIISKRAMSMCYLDEVRIGILFDDGEISVYDLEFDGYILDYSK